MDWILQHFHMHGDCRNNIKAFGLTFINDDHFFSYVAIFQNILNGSSRIVWGALYDRFKFKKCFTAIALIATVFMITIIFLPYLGDTTLMCYSSLSPVLLSFFTLR